jgi:hypothetical protein
MWPQTVYQRELRNKMARYLVAYEPAPDELYDEEPAPDGAGVRRLVRRIFGGPSVHTGERILGMAGLWCMMGDGHIVTIATRPRGRSTTSTASCRSACARGTTATTRKTLC